MASLINVEEQEQEQEQTDSTVYILKLSQYNFTMIPLGNFKFGRRMSHLNLIIDGIDSINKMNKLMLEYIRRDDRHISDVFDILHVDDIINITFYIMRYRRCTIYLSVQISSRGIRFMAYADDSIKHSATSFGTSMQHVKVEDVKQKYKENIESVFKKLEAFRFILNTHNTTFSIEESITNFESLFGI